jgi:drug/metabolite transporter (DMT)-like permease
MLDRLAPAIFVLLWSTGWIVAKYAAVHADPLTFLAARHALAAAIFLAICLVSRSRWPKRFTLVWKALVSGVFLHGLYLAGVWYAIGQGVPSGLSGIIAGLQPLLTALAAPMLVGERLGRHQRVGLVLGFAGILIAIAPQLLQSLSNGVAGLGIPIMINLVAMVSVTYGTLYQKRHLQEVDLLPVASLQSMAALVVTLPLVLWLENGRFDWTFEAIAALSWSVLGLSVAAVLLLLRLISQGQVSRAASLIYLMPPMVALEAALLFAEPLTWPIIVGTAIVVAGVYLVNRKAA